MKNLVNVIDRFLGGEESEMSSKNRYKKTRELDEELRMRKKKLKNEK
jgi:hypothetical protein